jgi:hypothetical protein
MGIIGMREASSADTIGGRDVSGNKRLFNVDVVKLRIDGGGFKDPLIIFTDVDLGVIISTTGTKSSLFLVLLGVEIPTGELQ